MSRIPSFTTVLFTVAASGLIACSGASGGSHVGSGGSGNGTGSGGSGNGTGSGGSGNSSSGGSGGFNVGGQGGGGTGGATNPPCTQTNPNTDGDGDGFTPAQGDCNDCDPNMNPGAFDYPGNGVDEDCNGKVDDEPMGCDQATVDIGYTDPVAAVQALGICRQSDGKSWGYVAGSAKYVKADGTSGMNDLSHGLLPSFGNVLKPREGARMLALSSGTARAPGMPGYQPPSGALMGTTSPTPSGFPVPAPACPNQPQTAPVANDPAALEFEVKAPTNASSLKFDFDFYTFEFPGYICSQFNDFFVALMAPAPPNSQNSNVSFDSQGNPVSVNNGFLEVCSPQNAGGKNFPCPQGTAELQGTGFAGHAATGWLETAVGVQPGQVIKFRFAIWDAGDHILDSTVLIDNMTWSVEQGSNTPVTQPVPK